MNKQQLIDTIAKENNLSKAAAGRVLGTVVDSISKALKKGDTVQLIGFGTFKTAKRAARTARNPATGGTVKLKATTVVKFKVGTALKNSVANKK